MHEKDERKEVSGRKASISPQPKQGQPHMNGIGVQENGDETQDFLEGIPRATSAPPHLEELQNALGMSFEVHLPGTLSADVTGRPINDIRLDEDYERFYKQYSGIKKLPPPMESRHLFAEDGGDNGSGGLSFFNDMPLEGGKPLEEVDGLEAGSRDADEAVVWGPSRRSLQYEEERRDADGQGGVGQDEADDFLKEMEQQIREQQLQQEKKQSQERLAMLRQQRGGESQQPDGDGRVAAELSGLLLKGIGKLGGDSRDSVGDASSVGRQRQGEEQGVGRYCGDARDAASDPSAATSSSRHNVSGRGAQGLAKVGEHGGNRAWEQQQQQQHQVSISRAVDASEGNDVPGDFSFLDHVGQSRDSSNKAASSPSSLSGLDSFPGFSGAVTSSAGGLRAGGLDQQHLSQHSLMQMGAIPSLGGGIGGLGLGLDTGGLNASAATAAMDPSLLAAAANLNLGLGLVPGAPGGIAGLPGAGTAGLLGLDTMAGAGGLFPGGASLGIQQQQHQQQLLYDQLLRARGMAPGTPGAAGQLDFLGLGGSMMGSGMSPLAAAAAAAAGAGGVMSPRGSLGIGVGGFGDALGGMDVLSAAATLQAAQRMFPGGAASLPSYELLAALQQQQQQQQGLALDLDLATLLQAQQLQMQRVQQLSALQAQAQRLQMVQQQMEEDLMQQQQRQQLFLQQQQQRREGDLSGRIRNWGSSQQLASSIPVPSAQQVCKFFQQGFCNKGNGCPFLHVPPSQQRHLASVDSDAPSSSSSYPPGRHNVRRGEARSAGNSPLSGRPIPGLTSSSSVAAESQHAGGGDTAAAAAAGLYGAGGGSGLVPGRRRGMAGPRAATPPNGFAGSLHGSAASDRGAEEAGAAAGREAEGSWGDEGRRGDGMRILSPPALSSSPPNSGTSPGSSSQVKYNSLEEVKGMICTIAKDQHGCRFLQRKFDEGSPEEIASIYAEMRPRIIELMLDPFGNYLVQKLLDVCEEGVRQEVLDVATEGEGRVTEIALNMHGTRVIQKLIEIVSSPPQVAQITSALRHGIVSLIKDINGNHVVQRCLQKLATRDSQFIFDSATANCVTIASHRHGCCVLQRCIDFATAHQRQVLIQEIAANSLVLSQDPFGNYVVQYILDLGLPWASLEIMHRLEGNYPFLAQQKFASNVVEKCLKLSGDDGGARERIIRELIVSPHLGQLLQDPYANYVVQSALVVSKGMLHVALVDAIKPHMHALRNSPYGKRILSRTNLKPR